jgi:hypothetical protein
MPKWLWLVICLATLGVGAVVGATSWSGGEDIDAYAALGFSIAAIGFAS